MVVAVKHVASDSFPRSLGRRNGCIFLGRLSRYSPLLSPFVRTHVRALERDRIASASASRVSRLANQSQSAGPPGLSACLLRKPDAVHLSPSFVRLLWRYVQRVHTCCSRAERENTGEERWEEEAAEAERGRGKRSGKERERCRYAETDTQHTHPSPSPTSSYRSTDRDLASLPRTGERARLDHDFRAHMYVHVSMYACRFPESSWLVAIVADDRARRSTVRLHFTGRATSTASIERFMTTLRQSENPWPF